MTLLEYLYVDARRLDAYIEQFGSLTTFDKVPTWKAGISIKGPEASISQGRHRRQLTQHEKAQLLLEHLQQTDQVRNGRVDHSNVGDHDPGDDDRALKPFSLETCLATRAFLRSKPGSSTAISDMPLWYAEPTGGMGSGSLLLMEEFAGDDRSPEFRVGTPCSALVILMDEMYNELRQSVIDPDRPRTSEIDRALRFTPSVIEVLRQLGARIGSSRRITTLYRVRAFFGEVYTEDHRDGGLYDVGTIGYPIFIRDS